MVEAESSQAEGDPVHEYRVRVADPQDASAVAALGIEDAGQEPLAPVVLDPTRPLDQVANSLDARLRLRPDRCRLLVAMPGRHEDDFVRSDVRVGEEPSRSLQRLDVGQRGREGAVFADDSAEVAPPVAIGVLGSLYEFS